MKYGFRWVLGVNDGGRERGAEERFYRMWISGQRRALLRRGTPTARV